MTEQNHPITPPPELVNQWWKAIPIQIEESDPSPALLLATRAAQWGAGAELEACIEELYRLWDKDHIVTLDDVVKHLRFARRPKPPSLAETATYELDEAVMRGDCISTTDAMPHLRAALKRLAELENQPQS